PFQDPSVTQLTNTSQSGLDEFNPFSESSQLTNAARTTPAPQPSGHSQPAVLQTSVEPTPQAVAAAAQAGLLQQQAELERKAAELEKKERELQSNAASINPRQNNWPPLPRKCPIKPCFYQDFSADIPADYQRICKMLYYLWMLHSITLFLNLLACLAWFTVQTERGVDFGLSILWFILFTPCAFLCWYRPIYKAFRQVPSFSFFVFFFIFFCQIAIYIIQAAPSGPALQVSVTGEVDVREHGEGGFWSDTCRFACSFFFSPPLSVSQVHSLYRRTGASFQRAQEEFSQGILTNRGFQNAAAGAASSAAQSAFRGN
ncbi:Secretory carrier-associated membrane protein 2, partial [Phoenicopterus ruber ruber]